MNKKIKILIVVLFIFSLSVFAKTQKEEYQNDILYSQEYFDYLIEYASSQKQEKMNIQEDDEIITDNIELNTDNIPMKLKIQKNELSAKTMETYKKEDTKTIIPLSKHFSFVQNTTKTLNKYNSNDYKFKTGIDILPSKFLNVETGIETNLSGLNQIPTSEKLYITPTLKFNDKFKFSFVNKTNTATGTSDHDLDFNISPFKSKAADFDIYAGSTHYQNGKQTTGSINFRTNFYFY